MARPPPGSRAPTGEPKKAKKDTKFKPGQSGNPSGRKPLTDKQRLARQMRSNAQPELVSILLGIARDQNEAARDRVAAAKSLLDEMPAEVVVHGELSDTERAERVVALLERARARRDAGAADGATEA